LLDEKQQLEGHIPTLVEQNKEMKAALAELEAVRKRKAEATTAAPKKRTRWKSSNMRDDRR
jgi:hypothetical protein